MAALFIDVSLVTSPMNRQSAVDGDFAPLRLPGAHSFSEPSSTPHGVSSPVRDELGFFCFFYLSLFSRYLPRRHSSRLHLSIGERDFPFLTV